MNREAVGAVVQSASPIYLQSRLEAGGVAEGIEVGIDLEEALDVESPLLDAVLDAAERLLVTLEPGEEVYSEEGIDHSIRFAATAEGRT